MGLLLCPSRSEMAVAPDRGAKHFPDIGGEGIYSCVRIESWANERKQSIEYAEPIEYGAFDRPF